jgi:hypothetical protein
MSTYNKLKMTAIMVMLCASFFSQTVNAGINQSIEDTLKFGQKNADYGQIKFDLRYRYEENDSKNPLLKPANALTTRIQLGYLSPEIKNVQGYIEYENNQQLGEEEYNSSRNGKTSYAPITDPQAGLINQAWLSYKGLADTEIKVGRQRFGLNNERFVGTGNWRQLQQSFDGVFLTNSTLPDTQIDLGYIVKKYAIDATKETMQFPYLNLNYHVVNVGHLTGYALLMDFNENHANSNQTYGIRFEGSQAISDDIKANYVAEYAYQRNYVQSPIKYQADYYRIEGGASAFGVTAQIGVEQLSGKGAGKTFNTPLASLHFFNGWADQYLVTPDNGLRDVYGSLMVEQEGLKLLGVYHQFSDDSGKIASGNEWDALVCYQFSQHYRVLAKYAYFDAAAGSGKFDTQKVWLSAEVKF